MFRLELALPIAEWRTGAAALLVACPPDTPTQRLVAARLPEEWDVSLVSGINSRQEAFLVKPRPGMALGTPVVFDLLEAIQPLDPGAFIPIEGPYSEVPEVLAQRAREVAGRARTGREALSLIVEHVSRRLTYDSTPNQSLLPAEVCGLQRGNCININTYFLGLLAGAGLSATYNIGFFFEAGQQVSDGHHCWVTTLVDGVAQDWDIPHHMKYGLGSARPGLNPKAGVRFAMSRGRGHRFFCGAATVELSHLSFPVWVFPGGGHDEERLNARLSHDASRGRLVSREGRGESPPRGQGMELESKPLRSRSADVFTPEIPGSKSYTNRALILASQSPGAIEIAGGLHSDDTLYLAKALSRFAGLAVQASDGGFRISRSTGRLKAPNGEVYLGGGGTPARFLMGFAAAAEGFTVVTGNARLSERPMGGILQAFEGMGVRYECLGAPDCLPVRIHGGTLATSSWRVEGAVSSQFLSSLLLAAAQQEGHLRVTISVEGPLVSKPYVDMTLATLRHGGIRCAHTDHQVFEVYPATPRMERIEVEADASGMSYFLVAAALTGTSVRITRIGKGSVQGDLGLTFALERMGCRLELGERELVLTGGPLRGIEIDMESMPDTVMSLAIAASEAQGVTRITHIGNLRVKECDRIAATRTELERLGGRVEEGPDYLVIHPTPRFRRGLVRTYDDHRIAMAFALLSLIHEGVEIEKPDCVSKSFPRFWQELARFRCHHEG